MKYPLRSGGTKRKEETTILLNPFPPSGTIRIVKVVAVKKKIGSIITRIRWTEIERDCTHFLPAGCWIDPYLMGACLVLAGSS